MTAVRAYFHTRTHQLAHLSIPDRSVLQVNGVVTYPTWDALACAVCTCMRCIPFQVFQLDRSLQNIHLLGTTVLTLAENKYSMFNDKNKGVQ